MNDKILKPQKFSSYQTLVVAILALLQFTIILDFQIIMPLGDMMMKGLSIGTVQFGWLVSCYAFGAGIMGVLASTVADRFDRKKFLLFFCLGFILGTLLCGFSASYYMLIVARSITGLFGGVIASISMAIVSDLFELNQRGRVMSYIQMAFSASQVLGLPAGILIANHWGWHMTFYTIVLLASVVLVSIIFGLKPVTSHQTSQNSEHLLKRLWRILTTKSYQTGLLFLTIVSISGAIIMPYSASFLINNVGVMQEELPLVYICTGLATIVILPLIGRLSDQVDKYKLFLMGSILSIVVTLIFTNLTATYLWCVIALNILVFVSMSCCSIPSMALITEIPKAQDRGSYMSLGESLQLMANGIGAIVAGNIIQQNDVSLPLRHFDWLGYIVVAVSFICIFLLKGINRAIKLNYYRKSSLKTVVES